MQKVFKRIVMLLVYLSLVTSSAQFTGAVKDLFQPDNDSVFHLTENSSDSSSVKFEEIMSQPETAKANEMTLGMEME